MNPVKFSAMLLAVALFAAPTARAADPAVEKVQSFYATLVDTMKRGGELGIKGRYQALAPAVDSTFDIPTMIKFIVGPSWTTMSEADHKSLTEAFRRMTIADYANNFDSYHGEQFTVQPDVETRGTDTFVKSNLVPKDGKPTPFDYRMRSTPAGWKVIDVYLNGTISQLTMKRSDYSATLASGGASALVKKLDSLADSQMGSSKSSGG